MQQMQTYNWINWFLCIINLFVFIPNSTYNNGINIYSIISWVIILIQLILVYNIYVISTRYDDKGPWL